MYPYALLASFGCVFDKSVTEKYMICTRSRAIITSAVIYFIMTCVAIPSAMRYKTVLLFDNDTNLTYYDVNITPLWQDETFASVYNWVQNFLRCYHDHHNSNPMTGSVPFISS
jgi:hypothetical protein